MRCVLCADPYENEPESTKTFESAIVSGLRPNIPDCCPTLQELLAQCWKEKPEERPTMDEIVGRLEALSKTLDQEKLSLSSSASADSNGALSLAGYDEGDELPPEVIKLLEQEKKLVCFQRISLCVDC